MILRYTPQAQKDLRVLKWYIAEKLQNKTAAVRIPQMILKSCSHLKENTFLGFEVAKKIDIPTDYRCLVCKEWLVFYKVEESYISVERIIDGRTDYISFLFG